MDTHTPWINFKEIMLSVKSQPQKVTYGMIPHMQYLWNNIDKEIENRLAVVRSWGGKRGGCGYKGVASGNLVGTAQLSIFIADTDGQQANEKMLGVTNYQRNANQNYNEVPLHTGKNVHH